MRVFYCWQSDLPNSTNRGFIEDAIERALKALAREDIVVEPIDRDTAGVPGAPEIAPTILRKIDDASIVVADVSIIGTINAETCANPNVLFEAGYAMGRSGFERLLLVMNTSYGAPEQLPFDLRQRRVLPYELREGDEKGPARERLVGLLSHHLRLVIDSAPTRSAQPVSSVVQASQEFLPFEIAIDESMEKTEAWLDRVDRLGLDRFISDATNRYPRLKSELLDQAVKDAARSSAVLYKALSGAKGHLEAVDTIIEDLWQRGSIEPHPYLIRARNAAIEAESSLGAASAELGRLKRA
ncbi:MAG TPA: hypothetical protein VNT29_03045 [Candidatus Limnocylindrales bacterium]|nr:hypothetical protein [Candidatus Limnocylindrales bacterium]